MRKGAQTLVFGSKPVILSRAAIGGKKEGEGPLAAYFDFLGKDAKLGQKTFEKAESKLQELALDTAKRKLGVSYEDIDVLFAGDLLNQCIGTAFGLRGFDIPFFGLYGACSTMGESLALGSLLSSKLNQWTLLVGMIPGVYAVSSGGTTPINLDPHQFQEIFLTAGQSIFAVALLLDLRLGLREAAALLVFFLAQLFSPFYDVQLEALLGLPHDPLRLHNFYAWTYLILAGLLLLRHWRLVAELRYGFHVKVRDIVHH